MENKGKNYVVEWHPMCIALHIAVCLLFYLYLLYKFPPEEHYGCHTKDPEQDWSLTQYYFSGFSQSKINVICDLCKFSISFLFYPKNE